MGVNKCGSTDYACLASWYNGSTAAEQKNWAGKVGRNHTWFNAYAGGSNIEDIASPSYKSYVDYGSGATRSSNSAAAGAVDRAEKKHAREPMENPSGDLTNEIERDEECEAGGGFGEDFLGAGKEFFVAAGNDLLLEVEGFEELEQHVGAVRGVVVFVGFDAGAVVERAADGVFVLEAVDVLAGVFGAFGEPLHGEDGVLGRRTHSPNLVDRAASDEVEQAILADELNLSCHEMIR